MSWEDNPMNKPEQYGMVRVGEIDLLGGYEFYVIGVLRNDQGYYLSTDQGCSCPTPWESHTLDDFTGPLTADQAREEVDSLIATAYANYLDPREKAELYEQIV